MRLCIECNRHNTDLSNVDVLTVNSFINGLSHPLDKKPVTCSMKLPSYKQLELEKSHFDKPTVETRRVQFSELRKSRSCELNPFSTGYALSNISWRSSSSCHERTWASLLSFSWAAEPSYPNYSQAQSLCPEYPRHLPTPPLTQEWSSAINDYEHDDDTDLYETSVNRCSW